MTKKYRGFTLIELLVVIAIIGILASIVLVSLTTARSRAYDAEIKSELAQMRAGAELYYMDMGGTYTNFNNNAAFTALKPPTCSSTTGNYGWNANVTAYAAWANMCSSGAGYWCVDSTGFSGNIGLSAPSTAKCQ